VLLVNRITQQTEQSRGLPPELEENYCHIAPEWENRSGQKLWFVNAPYGGTVLRFRGEPTSIMYAIAPLVQEIKHSRIPGLSLRDVSLLNPFVRSERFYLELERRLRVQDLRALCIGTMTAGSQEARRIAEIARRLSPETIVIFGGPHEDDIPLKTSVDSRYSDLVDFSLAGDGEYALLQLIRILFETPHADREETKRLVLERAADFAACPGRGSLHFSSSGQARELKLRQDPIALDSLPFMPRELLHESDTRTFSIFKRGGWNVKTAQIMTHRGCAWRCNFCSESAALNMRSVESVVAEIEHVVHFQDRHPDLERANYQAVFFDDSTFTTRAPRRKRFLEALLPELRRMGLEWGCQTRLDQIDEDTLRAMKSAGCTYLYTGLESASDQMLRAMVKDETRTEIDKAFSTLENVGIRVGVSLIFGAAPTGSDTTAETPSTISETLDFVSTQSRRGNITMVSTNLATYYPGTKMTTASGAALDFQNSLLHSGFPWNRFEEGESFHPRGVDKEMAELIVRESINRFGEYVVDQDLYALEDYQFAYRTGRLDQISHADRLLQTGRDYLDFNHSSIARPSAELRAVAEQLSGEEDELSLPKYLEHCDRARAAAAEVMGLPRESSANVVLTRNATEASALCLWLSGLRRPGRLPRIVTTDAENLSIPRGFRFFMEHGNPHGRDLWSSFQDFGARRQFSLDEERRSTGIEVVEIDVLSRLDRLEREIEEAVTHETDLVVFSHVIRDNGRICDVADLCRAIRRRNPNVWILVDGAQAIGAVQSLAVENLGCDFYIGAPHKTLGTYPLGLLYMSDRAKENVGALSGRDEGGRYEATVLEGMFAEGLNVRPTISRRLSLPELVSFTTTAVLLNEQGEISRGDYGRLYNRRGRQKGIFLNELLCWFPGAEIHSPIDPERFSHFILSFRLPDQDNRTIVERLWRDHLLFVSYIARTDLIRFSFGTGSVDYDALERSVRYLRDVCSELASERKVAATRGLNVHQTLPGPLRVLA